MWIRGFKRHLPHEIVVPKAVFPLRAPWAWALASRFSFTCCALGFSILYVFMFSEWGVMTCWGPKPGHLKTHQFGLKGIRAAGRQAAVARPQAAWEQREGWRAAGG